MRIRIVTTVVIDTATQETTSKSTWHVEGHDQGLGSALAQAAAEMQRNPPPTPIDAGPDPMLADPRPHPARRESLVLAGLLEIREEVEEALKHRPPGRVLEVLKWIRQRRTTTQIRSVSSLFTSLVNKD
jgi:hypothetical protein